MIPPVPTAAEIAAARAATRYRYTDPVDDRGEPRITAADAAARPDRFPGPCGDVPAGFGPTHLDGGG